MSKYRITLDGKVYELEVEPIECASAPAAKKETKSAEAPAAAVSAPAAVRSAAPSQPALSGAVVSPMPGTILRVLAGEGDEVKSGQPVLVLEAMKMENEIVSPKDGKLSALYVSQGDSVQGGAALFEIGE